MRHRIRRLAAGVIVHAIAFASMAGLAQTAPTGGRTIALTVHGRPGEEAGTTAALVARHLARHLGEPATISVESRTTGAAIDILNRFATEAPRDGSSLLLVPPNAALLQALKANGVAYDAGQFGWLGALSRAPYTLATSWVTGFRTLDDGRRREMDLGSIGETAPGAWHAATLNALLRTRFRVVPTFRSDKEVDAAIENSEIGGRIQPWSTLAFNQPALLAAGKLSHLVQIGPGKIAALGEAPLFTDLLTAPRDREIAVFMSADAGHGRAIALPPGTPTETLDRYRKAFAAMVSDPAFIAEAAATRIEISAVEGGATAALVASELSTPADVVGRTRVVLKEFLP